MRQRTSLTLALLAGALVLAGCASPGPSRPLLAPVEPARIGLNVAEAGAPELSATEGWWKAFGDVRLDALVERAVADHPGVQAATARLARAQAAGRGVDAAGQAQAGLSVDAARQRYTANGMVPAPVAGTVRDTGTIQLGGSWSPDFFGRHRAALAAAVGQELAADAELAHARQGLATAVVRQYVALARLLGQREVADRAVQLRERTLELVRARVRSGLDTQVELHQAEAAVPDARTQRLMLDEQITLARHAMAALTQQPPEALAALAPRLAALQPAPLAEGRVSTDLLGRRADIVAARWRVEAAAQNAREARAQFYPDVQISAFVGLSALGLDRVLQLDSRQAGIAPALRLPLFDAGRLRAQLQVRAAEIDAAVAAYNGAVLEAVRESADALASGRAVQAQRQEQARALAGVEQAFDAAQRRYDAGLAGYLTVLSAEQQLLAQRRAAVDLQARVLDTQAQLMQSLGGGHAAPVLPPDAPRATAELDPTRSSTR
jgi:NodT family efflux transporter outer membrane factor (OMF) lipoprotein